MKEKYKRLNIRLTQSDYDKLIFQVKKLNTTQVNFMRELIRKSMYEDIRTFNTFLEDIWRLTRIISNNVNQIAKKANTRLEKGYIFEIVKINEELRKLWQSLKS